MHRPRPRCRHRHNSFVFQLITTTTTLFPGGSSCCFIPSSHHHLHRHHHLIVSRKRSYHHHSSSSSAITVNNFTRRTGIFSSSSSSSPSRFASIAPPTPTASSSSSSSLNLSSRGSSVTPHHHRFISSSSPTLQRHQFGGRLGLGPASDSRTAPASRSYQRHPTSLNTMSMMSTISSLLSESSSSSSGVVSWIKSQVLSYWYYIPVGLYLAIELLFMVVFYTYMIPRANKLTEPAPYRDYPNVEDRTNLMLRIMHRIEKACHVTKKDETSVMKRFLTEWFHIERNRQNHNQRKTIQQNGVQSDDDCKRPTTETTPKAKSSKATTAAVATVAVEVVPSTTSTEKTPGLDLSPSSSPENSDDDDDESESDSETNRVMLPTSDDDDDDDVVLYRQDMDEFFSWAFFGKFHDKLSTEESKELERIYDEIEKQHPDLTFPPKPPHLQQTADNNNTNNNTNTADVICKARRMTLEPMRAMYRPLSVYLGVGCLKIAAGLVLRYHGFQRITTESGLVAWYRPASSASSSASATTKDRTESSRLPLLFFHGIAPGGFALYLPLLLKGFATETDRPVFLFENKSISCAIDFHPLTEERTVDGVIECLEKCDMANRDISLMGHSFGSCTIAWLVAAALSSSKSSSSSQQRRKRQFTNSIKQIVLIDPVAILLSEPDVMVNFLYSNEIDKIKIAASSELFTEWYLRRNFAWYNSELHLDDVSKLNKDDDIDSNDGDSSGSRSGCEVLVALSENDEIINATKVKQEIERHGEVVSDLIYWTDVGHGAAVPSPSRWKEVKDKMLRQEERILEHHSQNNNRRGERQANEDKKSK